MSEVMSTGEAQGFYRDVSEQLNRVVTGEPDAIEAAIAGAVSGMPFVLLGPVGGAKSTLIESISELLTDVDANQTVILPSLSDMPPTRVVGGTIKQVTQIEAHNSVSRETKIVDIESLIPYDIVCLLLDEINRGSMPVANALLRTLENKQLLSTAGKIDLNELLIVASSMNQQENPNHAVMPVSPAVASRHAVGTILGGPNSDKDAIADEMLDDPAPIKVDQIADVFTFLQVREHAKQDMAIAGTLKPLAKAAILATLEMMDSRHVEQATGRFTRHIGRIARVHAALTGEKSVTPHNIHKALKWAVTAKVGMLTNRVGTQEALAKVDQIVDETLPKVA